MFATASAHNAVQLVRARRAGAALIFLSPVYATASHPGGRFLGVLRWAGCARRASGRVAGLGGLDGQNVRRLPQLSCTGIGAIGALLHHSHSVS
jgi:thiamine-phosphate pyrophosphorylase